MISICRLILCLAAALLILMLRQREFQSIRNSNTSGSALNSRKNSELLSQSCSEFTLSTENQSQPKPTCLNCYNKELRSLKCKGKEKVETRGTSLSDYLASSKDHYQQYRENLNASANAYNKELMKQKKHRQQNEKLINSRYMEQALRLERSLIQQSQLKDNDHREKIFSYSKQLRKQYNEEILKKKARRQNTKQEIKPFMLQVDSSAKIKKYNTELKNQIKSNQNKKKAEKENELRKEREAIEMIEKNCLENTQTMGKKSAYRFDGAEQSRMYEQKKQKDREKRKKNNQERAQQLKEMNQTHLNFMRTKMYSMHQYVNELRKQAQQQKQRQKTQATKRLQYVQNKHKYEEQQPEKERKSCGRCHKKYPQKYVSML